MTIEITEDEALELSAYQATLCNKLYIASTLITQVLNEAPQILLTRENKNKLYSVRNAVDEANYINFRQPIKIKR